MSTQLNNKDDVCDYLEEKMVKFKFRGQPQQFLPRSTLEEVTRREVVQKVIRQDPHMILNAQDEVDLVNRISRTGRKLFAICMHCDNESMQHLKVMLDNGITDDALPLRKIDFGNLKEKRSFVNSFIANQKHFNTISLSEYPIQRLDDNQWDTFTIPIDFREDESNCKGKGAFGTVWKVKIHDDHRSFPCKTNDKGYFAMKITPHEGREIDYHRQMFGLKHPHLVKCLASFTLGANYQMIYELASCDLECFMREHPNASKCPELTETWFVQQLVGLASAIELVHNPEGSKNSGFLDILQPKKERTGYIHDIKPENILVFIYPGNLCWLQLSDFSCAKVKEFVATISGKRDSYKTTSKPGTLTYRAPESSENACSRPYDMWTLGCVYLELLVWYIEGYRALKDFRESREGSVSPNATIDEGFYYTDSSGAMKLRISVLDKIQHLSKKCSGDVKEIANSIPLLLEIERKKRITASQLAERLVIIRPAKDPKRVSNYSASLPTPAWGSTSLPTWDSDSDNNDFIKVTRPSDEQ